MKGFCLLLLYFFTWRSVITGSALLGLGILGVLTFGANVGTLSANGGIAPTLLAFVLLLVVPYIAAPKALRTIISNRRLALVPGLPLRTGLAMLLLTLLVAGFIPLTGWLLGAPGAIFWLGPQIFIVASLYTLMSQLLVTSRYVWVHVQWMPIAVLVFISLFGEQLLLLATNRPAVMLLATLAFAGWLYMLVKLARRPHFQPAYATDIRTADNETNSFFSFLLNRHSTRNLSPTTSLLLGYPANLKSRALNIVFVLVFNPIVSVVLVAFMGRNDNPGPMSFAEIFLGMSLFTALISGAMAWTETGPRARLLWLRIPGTRAKVWETVERELWDYFKLLFALTALIAVVFVLIGEGSVLLVHYILMLFTLAFYQRYLPLAARVNGWGSLTQALILIGSVGAIVFTLLYSVTVANFNLAFLLELCLLLAGVLFRALAISGFKRVDWQAVRPTPSKHAGATA